MLFSSMVSLLRGVRGCVLQYLFNYTNGSPLERGQGCVLHYTIQINVKYCFPHGLPPNFVLKYTVQVHVKRKPYPSLPHVL
jgi:hypothetical protein